MQRPKSNKITRITPAILNDSMAPMDHKNLGNCNFTASGIYLQLIYKNTYVPPFNRNPYNGYINPYYWVDDHPLLYGNNGSLDPGTY